MPGTFRYSDSDEASKPPPPPVAPRVTVQSWQSVPVAPPQETIDSYPHHVRSGSVDSLESNSGSSVSSSGCGAHTRQLSGDGEFIPTRTVTKTPTAPSHNPLQFVKVQSPLYRKAEQQIKLAKEVKITRDKLKEVEEEWQSNLDNWKSRRRKVSEKVFQRVEEMRQIEAEEQSRQNQQQRKIKTFSEIVGERSSKKRNYNLELYMGQGDDSGVGGTPEPDDQNGGLDVKNSGAPSDVSEEVTSEGESLDSDARSSDKAVEKTPPKVPKKPHSWFSRNESLCESSAVNRTSSTDSFHCAQNERFKLDHSSSAEPSDVEGHAGDIETVSSEDDTGYCGPIGNCDSGLESLCGSHLAGDIADSASDFSQDSCSGTDKIITEIDQAVASSDELEDCKYRKHAEQNMENSQLQYNGGNKLNFRIFLKQGIDSKGFGFTLKGGADCDTSVFVDSVVLGGAADLAGLKSYDEILSINGEGTSRRTHSALVFAVKQAMYTGQLDMVIWRPFKSENQAISQEHDPGLVQVKKGSSFAEKIALFSGNSSAEVNCSKSSPVVSPVPVQMRKISHQSQELKKESLVLRRRSAFEKNSVEEEKDQNKSRWSACLSQEISPVNRVSDVDRRHSLDCTQSSDKISPEKNAKKPPPPPVPSKPKIKLKDNNFELHHVNDECRELLKPETNTKIVNAQNVSSLEAIGKECDTESNKNIVSHPSQDMGESKNCKIDSNNFSSSAIYLLNEQINNTDLVNPVSPSTQVYAQDRETLIEGREYMCRSEITAHFEENIPKISTSDCHSTVSKHNVQIKENFETKQEPLHKHSETYVNNVKISSYSDENIKRDIEESLDYNTAMTQSLSPVCLTSQSTDDYLALKATVNSNSKDSEQVCPQDESNGEKNVSFDENTDDMQSNTSELSPDNGVFNKFLGHADFQENISFAAEKVQRESNLHYSLQTESEVTIADIETQQNGVQANSTRFTGNTLIENEFNNEVREYFVEMNLSPGHLTLERIDEDDVVSASTTTSSETPDTETVIEHFPSNISPLPTDDPITDIQTVEYIDDKDMTNPETPLVSPIENVGETENVTETANDFATVEPCDPLQILELHKQAKTMSNEDQEIFDHSQEGSLDEDAMYEIEKRLMQQLEQQGEVMLEDMSELHGQLEDEVNRQLLYLSEDSELLDDLDTPSRNAEPPSEPPPPPPPPEMEATENKTSPLMRINSTKRIKKELWRRRSDFLGLESTEGIDVDNILPPPPGLEELLKSEREIERGQRQWLEQRLSLQEPLSPVALEAVTNAAITGDICSPEHILEILDAEVYDAVTTDDLENDEWKLKEEYPLPVCEKFVQESQLNSEVLEDLQPFENSNSLRSPQLKARQNIQTLGAAPRAKIMDSDKWITQSENHTPKKQKSLDPVFQDGSTSQSSRHVLEAEKRNSFQSLDSSTHMYQNRRLSMPPTYGTKQPDVTVRTWGDREFEAQNLQRPKSSVWQVPPTTEELYGDYLHSNCPVSQGSSTIDLIESHYELQDFERSKAASHRRRCSCCGDELSEGSAMGIDALQLYFHIECFKCCICQVQLGNGSCGTDVQVKHSQLYCHSCFTPD